MSRLETILKEQGLFFSAIRALILACTISICLKLLEYQFVKIPNLVESFVFDLIRSFIFVFTVWFSLDRVVKYIDKFPSMIYKSLSHVFLKREEEFRIKQYVYRLLISIILTLPVYLLVYFSIYFWFDFTKYDYFQLTPIRAVTFYFLFMPFFITVLDLKIQLQVGRFLSAEKLKRETLLKEKDAQLFKAKLKPHFLFNTLNSIASLIRLSPETAEEMVEKLSDFFRATLELSDKEFVSVEEECEMIAHLIYIEKSRFGKRLDYISTIEDKAKLIQIPSLLIQPFIENSIKHGVEKSIKPVQLSLDITYRENKLYIVVSDTGKGCDLNMMSHGYGLKTTLDRLKHYYDDRFKWQITTATKAGFKIELVLPIRK